MVEIFDPLGVRQQFDGEAAGPEDLPIIVPTPDESTNPASLPIRALPDLSELLQVLGRIPIGQQGRPIPPDLLRLLLLWPGRNGLDGFDRLKVEPFAPREPIPGAIPPGDPSPPDIDPEVPRPVPLPSPDPDFFRPLDPGFIDPAFTHPLPRRGDEDRFRLPVGADGRIDERQLVPGRKFVADTDGTEWRYNGDKFVKQSSPARRLTLRQMQKRVTGQGPTAVRLSPDEMLNQANLASAKGETASALKVAGASLDADQATDFAGRSAGDANPQGALSPNMGEQMQEAFRRNSLANQAEQAAAAADAFSPPLPLARKGSTFFDVQDPNFHKRFHPGVNPLEEEQRIFNASKVSPAGSSNGGLLGEPQASDPSLEEQVNEEDEDGERNDPVNARRQARRQRKQKQAKREEEARASGEEPTDPLREATAVLGRASLGIAEGLGGIVDVANIPFQAIEDLTGLNVASDRPLGGSESLKDLFRFLGVRIDLEPETKFGKIAGQLAQDVASVFAAPINPAAAFSSLGPKFALGIQSIAAGDREFKDALSRKVKEFGGDPNDPKSVRETLESNRAEIMTDVFVEGSARVAGSLLGSHLAGKLDLRKILPKGVPLEKEALAGFLNDLFQESVSSAAEDSIFKSITESLTGQSPAVSKKLPIPRKRPLPSGS